MIVDDFLKDGKWKMESGKWKGEWQEKIIEDQKVIFLKPMEFMNRS
jgi:peptidyl-tRNA hydrolase